MGTLFKSCVFASTLLRFASIYSMQGCEDNDIEISIRIKRGSLFIERQIIGHDKKLIISSQKSICPKEHEELIHQISIADQIAQELISDHNPENSLRDCLQKKAGIEESKYKSQHGDNTFAPKSQKPYHKDSNSISSWSNPLGYTFAISLGAITLVALHWFKWFKKG